MFTTFTAGKLAASDKDRLEPDSDGLYLIVRKSGRKTWLVRYYTGGKEKKLTLGDYPAVSLQEARRQRDEIKARVKSGMSARDEGAGLTFEKVAREWWRMKRPRLSAHYAMNVEYRLEHYILPAVGGVALTAFKRQIGAAFLTILQSAARLRPRGDAVKSLPPLWTMHLKAATSSITP